MDRMNLSSENVEIAMKIDRNDSLVLLASNEDPFWTEDQLLFLKNFSPNASLIIGLIVSAIVIFGLAANGTVLFIFFKFKRLRSPPANTFIINLAFSDMLASILHSMSAYSNFNGRWAFGRLGCKLYAMGITCFGLVSILTFSAIACERCLVIGLVESRWRVSRFQAKIACVFIWMHCVILTCLPLFGWSSYVPEGLLTTCSWDYKTRTTSNRAYYVLLLSAGFLLPVFLIFICYGRILFSLVFQARQTIPGKSENNVFHKLRRQTEIRTAKIVVSLVLVYLAAWTPYAIVTFIGQFGPEDFQMSPIATSIPAYFAKTAVFIDPLVFSFSHPHFRNSFKSYLLNLCTLNNTDISSDIQSHNQSGGASKYSSKSWPGGMPSSYQSRLMPVYPPSACCALRICDPSTCTRFSSSQSVITSNMNRTNKKRRNGRMLSTFRELSSMEVNETSFSTNIIVAGTVRPVFGKAGLSQGHGQQAHSNYKVRNAEFFSEIIVPSISVVDVGQHV